MPRLRPFTFSRALCIAIGTSAALQIAPAVADEDSGRGFTRPGLSAVEKFPAGSKRFALDRPSRRSGPHDLAATSTARSSSWRLCQQCGTDGEEPKRFKPVGLRASFQPLGGTFSYRF